MLATCSTDQFPATPGTCSMDALVQIYDTVLHGACCSRLLAGLLRVTQVWLCANAFISIKHTPYQDRMHVHVMHSIYQQSLHDDCCCHWQLCASPGSCVNTSTPFPVMSKVCSNCAVKLPSAVTTVQPSLQVGARRRPPKVMMGSMVKAWPSAILPGCQLRWCSTAGAAWKTLPMPCPTNSRTTDMPAVVEVRGMKQREYTQLQLRQHEQDRNCMGQGQCQPLLPCATGCCNRALHTCNNAMQVLAAVAPPLIVQCYQGQHWCWPNYGSFSPAASAMLCMACPMALNGTPGPHSLMAAARHSWVTATSSVAEGDGSPATRSRTQLRWTKGSMHMLTCTVHLLAC